MAEPAPTLAAGSAGTVETQYLDLAKPVRLDCGRELHPIRVAYETYGALSPRRDNVILVCHALSGDAHAAGFAKVPPEESTRDGFAAEDRDGAAGKGLGWWDGMTGPARRSTPTASASGEIADALRALGKPVELHVIEAPYGHTKVFFGETIATPLGTCWTSRRWRPSRTPASCR